MPSPSSGNIASPASRVARGDRKTVHFVSLGCPKNRVDTEVMLGHTSDAGYELVTTPETADVIVINTCGFIGEAKQESVDAILEMAKYKEAGSCQRLVVTGCLSQRYPKELADEMPEVDHFLGTDEVDQITTAISASERRVQVVEKPRFLYDDLAPRRPSMATHTAYVKIAEGCDRPCAFCIIPQLRGPQRSRAPESVLREVQALAAAGTKEICLVAQDLTTYGRDLPNGKDEDGPRLATLLKSLAQVQGIRWIRLHYAYPTAVTDELLDVMASEPRVAKYLDVPLQHVDDGVLKSMRRGHTSKAVYDLVERARRKVPGLTLRTTFIVGHPGETDEAFEKLRAFVAGADLDRVGVFPYSKEDGTVSALLPLRVLKKDSDSRRRALMRLQRDISKKKMAAFKGKEIEVLVEGPSEESEYVLKGRHEGQAPEIDGQVFLTLDEYQPRQGELVRAIVTGSAEYDLAATVLGPAHVS
ncbi:MAG: 30S ribosomal protein S12 methylthiotransferase RimO [Deltaproteobacteria bacterium]|nr:30S ribosomal protein S12 methylthiotransferase RimO [Deltaproteobacteria bacterium]